LNNPSDADDLSPVEIHTLEAIPVRRASCELFLDFVRVSHELNRFVGVEISASGGKAGQRVFGVFEAVAADEPLWSVSRDSWSGRSEACPWRFRCEKCAAKYRKCCGIVSPRIVNIIRL